MSENKNCGCGCLEKPRRKPAVQEVRSIAGPPKKDSGKKKKK